MAPVVQPAVSCVFFFVRGFWCWRGVLRGRRWSVRRRGRRGCFLRRIGSRKTRRRAREPQGVLSSGRSGPIRRRCSSGIRMSRSRRRIGLGSWTTPWRSLRPKSRRKPRPRSIARMRRSSASPAPRFARRSAPRRRLPAEANARCWFTSTATTTPSTMPCARRRSSRPTWILFPARERCAGWRSPIAGRRRGLFLATWPMRKTPNGRSSGSCRF